MNIKIFNEEFFQNIYNKLEDIQRKLEHREKKAPKSESWLNTKEAAKMLHVSTRTIHSMKTRGEINYYQRGSKVLFRLSDLEAHLEEHYVTNKRNEVCHG